MAFLGFPGWGEEREGPTEESRGKRTPRPQYLSQRPGQTWDLKTIRYKRLNWWVPGHWSDRKAAWRTGHWGGFTGHTGRSCSRPLVRLGIAGWTGEASAGHSLDRGQLF